MDGKAESSSRQGTSNFTEEEVRCLLELVRIASELEIACRSRFQTVPCSCLSANIILNMDGKAESSSRQRTFNFTEEEVHCLLELVKERAEVLFSKLNNSVTVERKQTLWEDIATRVNARGKTQRPTQKVKKKWSDLPYASEAG